MSYVYFNNNPCGARVGDCAVRAVATALGLTWRDAFLKIVTEGYGQCNMPSADSVWGAVLQQHGFVRKNIPDTCPPCYTAERFCKEHPQGIYVLGFGGHTATVIDGDLYDTWDSSNEVVIYIWYQPHKEA